MRLPRRAVHIVSLFVPTVNADGVAAELNWAQLPPAGPHVTVLAVPPAAVAQLTRSDVAVASVRYGARVRELVAALAAGALGMTAASTDAGNRRSMRRAFIGPPRQRRPRAYGCNFGLASSKCTRGLIRRYPSVWVEGGGVEGGRHGRAGAGRVCHRAVEELADAGYQGADDGRRGRRRGRRARPPVGRVADLGRTGRRRARRRRQRRPLGAAVEYDLPGSHELLRAPAQPHDAAARR